jgi:uncharacterized coiled-coil protein SlyX
MRHCWASDVSKLSRNIQALTGDVVRLRTEIERLRTDLSSLVEQFLNEMNGTETNSPAGEGGDRSRAVRALRACG